VKLFLKHPVYKFFEGKEVTKEERERRENGKDRDWKIKAK
jgi:hypothetical protein